jgi:hypothetical protein
LTVQAHTRCSSRKPLHPAWLAIVVAGSPRVYPVGSGRIS